MLSTVNFIWRKDDRKIFKTRFKIIYTHFRSRLYTVLNLFFLIQSENRNESKNNEINE